MRLCSSKPTSDASVMANKTRLSVSVNAKRWAAYSAAGIATSLGVQQTAEADIIHNVYNQRVADPNLADNNSTSFIAPLATGPGGSAYLRFRHLANNSNPGIAWASLLTLGGGATGALAGLTTQGYRYPQNVPYLQRIDLIGQFTLGNGTGSLAYNSGFPNTQFGNAGEGFLAFRFNVGNGTQYGWARLQMDGKLAALPNAYEVVDVAFGAPGDLLWVGKLDVISEPGSLGILALGAVGLLAWRRKRRSSPVAA